MHTPTVAGTARTRPAKHRAQQNPSTKRRVTQEVFPYVQSKCWLLDVAPERLLMHIVAALTWEEGIAVQGWGRYWRRGFGGGDLNSIIYF